MSEKKIVNALVSGGEASAGPPLGPALAHWVLTFCR